MAILEMTLLVLQVAEVLYTGISKAVTAARAGNDEEALEILQTAIDVTTDHVSAGREKLAKNKQEHADAIDKKFSVENADTKQP